MSLLIDPPAPTIEAPPDAEALIEEARRRQRRRRLLWAAGVLAATLVGLVLYFGIFHGGGSGLLDGSGGSAPSATYHRGWILHERDEATLVPYAGAGRYVHLVFESWKETSPPYRTRELTYPAWWNGTRVERGSSGRQRYAYDPKSNTIYEDHGGVVGSFVDPATNTRRMIDAGQWKIVGRTTIDGRRVLKVVDKVAPLVQYYVDAETYVTLEIRSPGQPLKQPGNPKPGPSCTAFVSPQMPQSRTIVRTTVHEYLPPTDENRKLLEVGKQHPDAPVAPAKEMPKSFRSIVNPPRCAPPPAP